MLNRLPSLAFALLVCGCGDAFTDAIVFPEDDDAAALDAEDLVDAAGDVGEEDGASEASDRRDALSPDAPADTVAPDAGELADASPEGAAPDASTRPDAGQCCNAEHCGEDGEMFSCGASQHVCEQGCALGDVCYYLGIASTVTACP
jgi:hypothetical protein